MSQLLRIYEESELGTDGYPLAWHECTGCAEGVPDHPCEGAIKDLVRELTGHRCIRCGHPYRAGENGNGEWSPCDRGCSHGGEVRGAGGTTDVVEVPNIGVLLHHGDQVEARWRILTVHHLTGCWGNEQEAKRDCRWWNLLALCQRCHLAIQSKVNPAQVYPHEHSEWFKPYAAGYYAATYLGEDLTREATMDRLEELLALELAS